MSLLNAGIFGLCVLIGNVRSDCNSFNGPSGGLECLLLEPYYNRYQYATCLTDSYIKLKSKGRHHCRDVVTRYCYYQCMLELNDIEEGRSLLI